MLKSIKKLAQTEYQDKASYIVLNISTNSLSISLDITQKPGRSGTKVLIFP